MYWLGIITILVCGVLIVIVATSKVNDTKEGLKNG